MIVAGGVHMLAARAHADAAAEGRCWQDLDPAACGWCVCPRNRPRVTDVMPMASVEHVLSGGVIRAAYDGLCRCTLTCDALIDPGDRIVRTEHGWALHAHTLDDPVVDHTLPTTSSEAV